MNKLVLDTENKTVTIHNSHNSSERTKLRVLFIRERFPEALSADPYTDRQLVERVKEAMFKAGFYTSRAQFHGGSIDEAVIKYIVKAQGYTPKLRMKRKFVDQREIEGML